MKTKTAIQIAKKIQSFLKTVRAEEHRNICVCNGRLHADNFVEGYLISIPFLDGCKDTHIATLIQKLELHLATGNETIANVGELNLTQLEDGAYVPDPNKYEKLLPGQLVGNLDVKALLSMVSQDAARYVLQGIFIDTKAQKLVATDGRRMGIISHLIPLATVPCIMRTEAIERMTGKFDAWIISSDKGTPIIKMIDEKGVILFSHAIDGTYPNWQAVIPTDKSMKRLSVSSGLLKKAAAIGIASRMDKFQVPKVYLTFNQDGLSANGHLVDETPFKVTFSDYYNAQYISDACDLMAGETEINFLDALSPIKMECESKMCVVMPTCEA